MRKLLLKPLALNVALILLISILSCSCGVILYFICVSENRSHLLTILAAFLGTADVSRCCCHRVRIHGELAEIHSSDELIDKHQEFIYPVEFLNSIRPHGLPLYYIALKFG